MYFSWFFFFADENDYNCVDWIGDGYTKIDKGNDIIQGNSKGKLHICTRNKREMFEWEIK